jgi:O-antigen ligase
MPNTQAYVVTALFLAAGGAFMLFNGAAFIPFSFGGTFLLLALGFAVGLRQLAISRDPLSISVIAFGLWWSATILWSPVPQVAHHGAWWLGSFTVAYLIFIQPGAVRSIAPIFFILFAAALALISSSLIQYYTGMDPKGLFLNRNLNAGLLNLLVLPWAGLVLERFTKLPARYRLLCLLLLGLHVHLLSLIGSRGALLAFFTTFGLLLFLLRRSITKQSIIWTVLAISIGLAAGEVMSDGVLGTRLASLASPQSAGFHRFLIWERALVLLQDTPWHGIGAGLFTFAFTPYRHPEDGSFGAYAHNDYLQFMIEGGLPTILIASAIFIFMVVQYRKTVHFSPPELRTVPLAGLLTGLLAVLLHSLFTFNLYVVPTLMVAGFYLALINGTSTDSKHPPQPVKVKWPAIALWGILGFCILDVAAIGYSLHIQNQAIAESGSDAAHAERLLIRASKLTPAWDQPYGIRAWLYIAAVDRLKRSENNGSLSEIIPLYDEAIRLAKEAISRNPLAAENVYIHAQALLRNPQPTPAHEVEVNDTFKKVIRLAPANHKFRFGYINYLALTGQYTDAQRQVTEGLTYNPRTPATTTAYKQISEALDKKDKEQRGQEQRGQVLTLHFLQLDSPYDQTTSH